MTIQDWKPIYERLCGGLSRKATPAQERAYFDALRTFPAFVVAEAVRRASARTWPPTHPHAGDLVELAAVQMRERAAPKATCDVCHGDTWEQFHCAGVTATGPETKPLPVDRANYCGRDWVHADHDYARRCRQCWTFTNGGE